MPKATTIPEYIAAAPVEGQPQLRKLYRLLKQVAPEAQEAIKWGTPFFIEPRFVFSFSAHKHHLDFAPSPRVLEAFAKELAPFRTTKYMLQVRYDEPLPEAIIRKLAERCVRDVAARQDDKFW